LSGLRESEFFSNLRRNTEASQNPPVGHRLTGGFSFLTKGLGHSLPCNPWIYEERQLHGSQAKPGKWPGRSSPKATGVIVLNEGHLRCMLAGSFQYDHRGRTPRLLAMAFPNEWPVQPPEQWVVVAVPELGGLHDGYQRCVCGNDRCASLFFFLGGRS
jgi:hypothetical protein